MNNYKADLAIWNSRASSAENAVISRYFKKLWKIPKTILAVSHSPASKNDFLFTKWDYWWEAHALDCLIDSYIREPNRERLQRIKYFYRGLVIRNYGKVFNNYYDDMAWFALAIERGITALKLPYKDTLKLLEKQFQNIWNPGLGGGIPWRKTDIFFNTPANAPVGILAARTNDFNFSKEIYHWIMNTLYDKKNGLINDGIYPNGKLVENKYTYCQGVVLGLGVELLKIKHDKQISISINNLTKTIYEKMTDNEGVLKHQGGGDGGLFAGILARYLALIITDLPEKDAYDFETKDIALKMLKASAEAIWTNKEKYKNHLVFSANWNEKARNPFMVSNANIPEKDLSVQVGAWMALEATYNAIEHIGKINQ